jgi:5-methylcytosine-specific restriction enzyme subunit McrC
MLKIQLPVFELAEWQTRPFPGVELDASDRRLAEKLAAGSDGRLIVEEMRTGIRVSAKSWVGVVRFRDFELRVVPKLAGGNVGLIEMIEFASGLSALRRNSSARTLDTSGAGLLDLLALLLAEHCEHLLQDGLLADYVERQEDLPVVRGRLLGDQQLIRRYGRVDRVICRFDEHEQDILENRLLAAALRLAADRVTHETVRQRVRGLRSIFDAVCEPEPIDVGATRERLSYNRLNEHYRDAHGIAYLLLGGLGADDLFISGETRCFAFLLDMNRLFERFVYRLVEFCLAGAGFRVLYQHSDRSIILDASTAAPYKKVIPDLLVVGNSGAPARLAMDAKYKLYDDRDLSSGDVYQSFLYAYAYGGAAELGLPVSLLVYPTTGAVTDSVRLRIKGGQGVAGAEIVALGLPIVGALAEVAQGVRGAVTGNLRTFVLQHLEPVA